MKNDGGLRTENWLTEEHWHLVWFFTNVQINYTVMYMSSIFQSGLLNQLRACKMYSKELLCNMLLWSQLKQWEKTGPEIWSLTTLSDTQQLQSTLQNIVSQKCWTFIELNSMALHVHTKDHTRAVIKGCNLQHLIWLSMLDSPKMLWVKLPVVDRIQPKLTGFVMGVGNKAWKVIYNLMTALQRQLQRSDITLIYGGPLFS